MIFVPQRIGSPLVALTEDLAGVAGRNGSAPAIFVFNSFLHEAHNG